MTTFTGRIDNNNANNPALNLTGDTAFEITFVPRDSNGDIVLEYDGGAIDPDTQVQINGVNYDFTFELSATLPTANSDGANQVPEEYRGSEIYLITIQDYPTAGESTRFAFLPGEEATLVDMDAFGNGGVSLQNIDTTTPGTVCFAAGTNLLTPNGYCAVEQLKCGDRVQTRDGDALEIVWIAGSRHDLPGNAGDVVPVLISKGALGDGTPMRDLVVSPLHKVLVTGAQVEIIAGVTEALVPAKALTALPGIRRMMGERTVTYYHVMLRQHAIVDSDGAFSESFYPGPTAVSMLSLGQKLSLRRAMVGLRNEGYGKTACPCLSNSEAKNLAEKLRLGVRQMQTA